MAALTAGGLVFGKSSDIEMRSEDLSISEKEIVVYTEHLAVQSALCVNQQGGWRSLHRICPHRAGKRIALRSWQVDRNRKTNAVLMQKRA